MLGKRLHKLAFVFVLDFQPLQSLPLPLTNTLQLRPLLRTQSTSYALFSLFIRRLRPWIIIRPLAT
jgi:hypothetical protein